MTLTTEEVNDLENLVSTLQNNYGSGDNPEFIHRSGILAHMLPDRIKEFLHDFRLTENTGACVIKGFPINNSEIGKTPVHWKDSSKNTDTVKQEMLFVLYGSILGDVFGWSSEQGGKLIQDILPIKGDENKQLNTASEELIWWHTEDSFQPYAPDYLGLFCLKNFEKASTTYAAIESIELGDEHKDILLGDNFVFEPDNAHKKENNVDADFVEPDAIKSSILFGEKNHPYLRIDPYFMDRNGESAEEKEAFDAIIKAFDEVVGDVVLEPGDALFVDNFKAIHGRKPFYAKYNGDDRWLKRIRIARDLRKSRSKRGAVDNRILS